MIANNQIDKNILSKSQLHELREQIDAIDDEIACLIQARMALVRSAASLKSESGEGAVSPVREKSILEHGAALEQKYHLPNKLMQDVQRRILRESYVEKGSGAFAQAHVQDTYKDTCHKANQAGNSAHSKDTALKEHDKVSDAMPCQSKDINLSSSNANELSSAQKQCHSQNHSLEHSSWNCQSKDQGQGHGCNQGAWHGHEHESGSELNKEELSFDKAHEEHGFRVCIVGGKGAMGRFFARYLSAASYEVSSIDVEDYSLDLEGHKVNDIRKSRASYYLAQAQWCIISVPIDVTVKVVEQVSALLNKDCVLSDLTSVKSDIMEAMLTYHSGPVMGLHPMFGPDTFSLVKQVVVAVSGRDDKRCAFIIEQLQLFGARVVSCSAQEHDDAMRVIQALRHFTTIAYGNFLKESFSSLGSNSFIERLLELSSPIYRLELMMVGRLFAQDPRLYCEIISASPKNFELIERYVTCAQHCLDKLKQDDKEGFVQDFNDTTAFFGEFAKLFLQESGSILALVQDTYHL